MAWLALVRTLTAFALPLNLIPVGDFGGIRVKAPCSFGAIEQICTLDTMGSVSVIGEGPNYARYPVIGHEKVSGIGQEFSCDVVDIEDFRLLGQSPAHLKPLRCAGSNPAFPLIGLPFFEDRVVQFDFPRASLDWDLAEKGSQPLLRTGAKKLWIAVPATFAGEAVLVSFDTGNPVTIVTRAFVDAHPAQFRASLRPISPGLLQKGLVPFEIAAPIVVDGVELKADYVYAGSTFPALFFEEAAILLGMNHAVQARWWLDLDRDLYRVTK